MPNPLPYPPRPADVPDDLTAPSPRYRLQVVIVLASLLLFFLLYIALVVLSAWLVYKAIDLPIGKGGRGALLLQFGLTSMAAMLFLFLLKGLFKRHDADRSLCGEITEDEQPDAATERGAVRRAVRHEPARAGQGTVRRGEGASGGGHKALAECLAAADKLRLPGLKNMTAGEPLGRFLLATPMTGFPTARDGSLDGQRVGELLEQLGEVGAKARRVHFKSLGGILALQETIAAKWAAWSGEILEARPAELRPAASATPSAPPAPPAQRLPPCTPDSAATGTGTIPR